MFEEIKGFIDGFSKISLKNICTLIGAVVVGYGVFYVGNMFLTAVFSTFKTLI